jgi:CheY-like chemotaxis protein
MKKILIAEDDFASRELLAEILIGWGYHVVQAANGLEALQQAAASAPDLVLLDIQMPLLDGFGVIERLRRDPKLAGLPVVALTAYAMRDDRARTTRAGFDAHIAKPLEMAALRDVLESRLGRSTSPRPSDAEELEQRRSGN